jgi:fumarate reductase subunit C
LDYRTPAAVYFTGRQDEQEKADFYQPPVICVLEIVVLTMGSTLLVHGINFYQENKLTTAVDILVKFRKN